MSRFTFRAMKDALMTLKIPVKPYVKNYIESRYGSPSLIPYKSKEGKIIRLLLRDDSHFSDHEYRQYPETVQVMLPEFFWKNEGTAITNTNVILFNTLIEDYIKDSMRLFVMSRLSEHPKRGEIKRAIYSFIDWFGLSEESFAYDTAKRDILRFRERTNIKAGQQRYFTRMAYA